MEFDMLILRNPIIISSLTVSETISGLAWLKTLC
jgi:hypothetical protein